MRPRIEVGVARDRERWRITVADSGIGIAEEHVERVFEPFGRLNGVQEFADSGMGLAMCRAAAERVGGRIWVEPDGDNGTRFHFTVRAVEDETP